MRKTNLLIFGLIVLLVILGVAIYMKKKAPTEIVIQEPPVAKVMTKPVKVPIVHYPIPEPEVPEAATPEQPPATAEKPVKDPQAKVLPDLQGSNFSLQEILLKLDPDGILLQLLVMDNLIPRLVVTIDNLPLKKLPQAHLPLKSPKGKFLVSGTSDAPQTSSRNYKRYEPYIKLLEFFDPEVVVNIYQHFYPLFQTAYKQLGYRNAYFNDRLIQVLDHLQTTPSPAEPMPLSQPSVFYTYADPTLEKLSSGQKILLRIGAKNRQRVLKIFAEYRQKLVNRP
jgi:hypothetical protein